MVDATKVDYKEIAREARLTALRLIYEAQTSHIGSNFSVADILAVLFEHVDPKRDEMILSAGWKAAIWYHFLWKKDIITEDELKSFCKPGSSFIGLTEPMNRWGLRFGGGSMGMGFPAAVGFALAKKMKGEEGIVYCLMSDGEMQVGTTWESALIAAHHQLTNLVVIVDQNYYQAMGLVGNILSIGSPYEKFKVFDWYAMDVNGHDYQMIEYALSYPDGFLFKHPLAIIAHTVKGKGVSFMESNNLYHYKNLSDEEYERARKELG